MAVLPRLEADPVAASALDGHILDTSNVHGIVDTTRLITQDNIGIYAPTPDLTPFARLDGTNGARMIPSGGIGLQSSAAADTTLWRHPTDANKKLRTGNSSTDLFAAGVNLASSENVTARYGSAVPVIVGADGTGAVLSMGDVELRRDTWGSFTAQGYGGAIKTAFKVKATASNVNADNVLAVYNQSDTFLGGILRSGGFFSTAGGIRLDSNGGVFTGAYAGTIPMNNWLTVSNVTDKALTFDSATPARLVKSAANTLTLDNGVGGAADLSVLGAFVTPDNIDHTIIKRPGGGVIMRRANSAAVADVHFPGAIGSAGLVSGSVLLARDATAAKVQMGPSASVPQIVFGQYSSAYLEESASGTLDVRANGYDTKLRVKPRTGQTADVFAIRNTADTADVVTITPAGAVIGQFLKAIGTVTAKSGDAQEVQTGAVYTGGYSGIQFGNPVRGMIGDVNSSLTYKSAIADGAAAVAHILDTTNSLVTAGAKLASFRTAGVEKAYVGYAGYGYFPGGLSSNAGALTVGTGSVAGRATIRSTGVSEKPLVIFGQPGQSDQLTAWYDPTISTQLAAVTRDGAGDFSKYLRSSAAVVADVPLISRGVPIGTGTQTGDLLQLFKQQADATPVAKTRADGFALSAGIGRVDVSSYMTMGPSSWALEGAELYLATANKAHLRLMGGTAPSTPSAGQAYAYADTDGELHYKGPSGFGSIVVDNAGKGLKLKSPDGLITKTLTIDNSGTLVVT